MKTTDKLEVWRAFVYTARTGSITTTSIQMNSEISAISRYIRCLEKEFGPLFERKRRPWKLTEKGSQLFARVTPVLNEFENLHQLSLHANKIIKLKVSAPSSLNRNFIALMLMEYAERHPNIEFELQNPTGLEGLLSGETDVSYFPGIPTNNNLIVRKEITGSTCALTSPAYCKEHGEPHNIDDLKNHIGLLHRISGQPGTSSLLKGSIVSSSIKWKNILYFDDQTNIKNMILLGKGISVDLTPTICIEELKTGQIIPVLKGWERQPWIFSIVTNKRKEFHSPEIKLFADWFFTTSKKNASNRMKEANFLIASYWKNKKDS